jgi:hypothetical protein
MIKQARKPTKSGRPPLATFHVRLLRDGRVDPATAERMLRGEIPHQLKEDMTLTFITED